MAGVNAGAFPFRSSTRGKSRGRGEIFSGPPGGEQDPGGQGQPIREVDLDGIQIRLKVAGRVFTAIPSREKGNSDSPTISRRNPRPRFSSITSSTAIRYWIKSPNWAKNFGSEAWIDSIPGKL